MRVVALLAVHDEERFVGRCIEHLASQGVETYLIDDGSTDATRDIAEGYLGSGLAGVETLSRTGTYAWRRLLARKEELAATLDGDWFVHVDADEIRLPPTWASTLAEAFSELERQGYNAVNFLEFTFVPPLEDPDHDHPRFQETMRWYYAYLPRFPDRLNAWRRQDVRVDLASSGGHGVSFPGLRMAPESFSMRHYLFLSLEHAVHKYVERVYDPAELESGWHGRRAALRPEDIRLLPQVELRRYVSDELLDPTDPLTVHPVFATDTRSGCAPS